MLWRLTLICSQLGLICSQIVSVARLICSQYSKPSQGRHNIDYILPVQTVGIAGNTKKVVPASQDPMGKPPRYPNSPKTVSERIPVRFCIQVRHFLETLDQLGKDFEVRCEVYQSGILQPMQLIYTEFEADTQFRAEVETPVEPVSQNGGLSAHEPAALTPDRLTQLPTEGLSDVVINALPLTSQNGSRLGAEFDTADLDAEDQWDTAPVSSNDFTLTTVAQDDHRTDSQPEHATPTDWEHSFTGDESSAMDTGRRPPTLTEILQGTYGGHVPTVQRTDVEAPGGLSYHSLEAEPDTLTDSQAETDLTPTPVAIESALHDVAHNAEANGSSTEAETVVTTPVLPPTTGILRPGAPVFRERSVTSYGTGTTPPVEGKTEKTWPTLEMSVIARFQTRKAANAAVPPVTPPATADRQAEALPEPSTAALTADDRTEESTATEAATPCPPVQSALEPVEPALDATLNGSSHAIEADDLQVRTEDHSNEAAEQTTTIPESTTTTVQPTTQPPNPEPDLTLETDCILTTEADLTAETDCLPAGEATQPPNQETETGPGAAESVTTLDEVPSATEAQPASTLATGSSEAEPLESSSPSDRTEVVAASAADVALELVVEPSATGNEPAIAETLLPAGDANLSAGDDDMVMATVSDQSNDTVTQPQAGDLTSATGEPEATLNESATNPLAQSPELLSVSSETRDKGADGLLLATAERGSLPPTIGLYSSLETGVETAPSVLESLAAQSETHLPETCSDGMEATDVPLQQAVVLSYALPVDTTPAEQGSSPTEVVTDPPPEQEGVSTETHLETVQTEAPADECGVEREPTASDGTPDLTPSPIPPTSTSVPVDEALKENCHSDSALNGKAETVAPTSTRVPVTEDAEAVDPHSLSETSPATCEDSTTVQSEALDSDDQAITTEAAPVETADHTDESLEDVPEALSVESSDVPAGLEPSTEPASEAAVLDDEQTEALQTNVEADRAETPSSVTVEPPDQGFAEDLFVVWRRLALQQSPTVWGVVVSLEDIYTQGFSSWFAPHFMGSLAAAEGVMVTWGCGAQLVNEADTPYQERERYQVGGKEVTGLTFQSPNARTNILETGGTTPSLKPFAQSPALLTSFSAEPLEADRQTDSSLTDLEHPTEADAGQWPETLSPVDMAQSPHATATVDEEDDEPLPANRPRKSWRDGLRLLLGR